MKNLIDLYIADHTNSWSETTIASETARLYSVDLTLTPQDLYTSVSGKLKPYSVNTLFIRLSNFFAWAIENGHVTGSNLYKIFMKKNQRLFKHAYKREEVSLTFEEAKERIESIEDAEVRSWALFILHSGVRISEAQRVAKGQVTGKGGKTRKIFAVPPRQEMSEWKLREELARVGLKPHTLRKLFMTQLAAKGAMPMDLCQIAGWSNIQTAYRYLQPKKDDELKALVKEIQE